MRDDQNPFANQMQTTEGAKDEPLLNDIKSSIQDMQSKMQSTYSNLSSINLKGKSHDSSIEIEMTATYELVDIKFEESAFNGGVKEFKYRLIEAWKNLMQEVQRTTQEKTLELLQGMNVPEEIRNMSVQEEEK